MPELLRLKKRWEFDYIFRTGIRVNGELVRLLYVKDRTINTLKFAPVAGKKLACAAKRNRARRILRHAFYSLSDKIIPGVNIILSITQKGLEAKTGDIARELEILLRKKNLCYPESQ